MIISEKQIMMLIDCAHGLMNRMVDQKEPAWATEMVSGLLLDITEQQSQELKEIK